MGWDKDSSITEIQPSNQRKQNQRKQNKTKPIKGNRNKTLCKRTQVLSTNRPTPSQSLGNVCHSQPLSFPKFYCWLWYHTVWHIPLVSWGKMSWLCPFNNLCTPSLHTGGVVWEAEKALALCQHCSEIIETSSFHQQFLSQIQTQHKIQANTKKLNSIIAKARAIFTPFPTPFTSSSLSHYKTDP